MSKPIAVTVQLLDRYYTFRCKAEEKESLQQAALLLDAKMRDVRDNQKMTVIERIAIAAGLAISHEVLTCQQQNDYTLSETNQQILLMQEKIQNALTQQEQLEL